MVDIGIKIIQLEVPGEPGQSRDDIVIGEEVTLINNDDGGVTEWKWELVSKPKTSSAVLTTPTSSTSAFTPDVIGSYLVQLLLNGKVKQRVVASILTANLGIRIPAIGESNEFVGGWAQAIMDALLIIDNNM